jgi:hypothetical protein
MSGTVNPLAARKDSRILVEKYEMRRAVMVNGT